MTKLECNNSSLRFFVGTMISFVLICLVSVTVNPASSFASEQDCRGELMGSVGSRYIDQIGNMLSAVPNARLFLQSKAIDITVTADNLGHFRTSLECGYYELQRVTDSDGTQLELSLYVSNPTHFIVVRDKTFVLYLDVSVGKIP